jgi:heptosyltransferase-2
MLKPKKFDAGCLLPNSFGSALLFYLARIPERWGYSRDGRAYLLTKRIPAPENEVPLHQVNYYLNLMAGLGLRTVHPEIKISLSSQEKALARRELDVRGLDPAKRIVILSPGAAYGPAKRWPVAKFAELATLFQKKLGFQILITGSADEAGLAESLSALMEKKPFVLAGQTTLRQLLSIISHAALFISNDSGPMHLANALRVPVIAIFGPTDPSITGPCQEPAIVLQKKAACWPCYYRSCPYDHRCLEGISTEEVFAASLRYCQ